MVSRNKSKALKAFLKPNIIVPLLCPQLPELASCAHS